LSARRTYTDFNSIAWYIPGVAFTLGLGIVLTIIRMAAAGTSTDWLRLPPRQFPRQLWTPK